MASLKKNVIYSSILTVANYIFPFITYPYISRVLGVDGIGVCNFVDGIINYFILFSMMGISIVGIREIAASKNRGQEALNRTFSGLFLLNTVATTIMLALLVAAIFLVPQLYEHKELMYVGALKLVFNYLLVEWLYKGLEDFGYITSRTLIVKSLYVAAIFLFVKTREDYLLYYLIFTMMTVINAVINIVHCRKFVKLEFRNVSLRPYLKPNFIFGTYLLLCSMYTTFNIAYLGFVSDSTEVGYYTTATKIYTLIIALYTAYTGAVMPHMSSLAETNQTGRFKEIFHTSTSLLLALGLPLVFLSEIFAQEIIRVISGPGYEGAVLPLRIVMPLAMVIGYEQILVVQTLMPLKKDRPVLLNSTFGAIAGLGLNLLLVPLYKSAGSSVVWLISEIVVMISAQYFVLKYTGLSMPLDSLLRNILFNIPLILLLLAIYEFCGFGAFYRLLLAAVITVAYIPVVQIYGMRNKVFTETLAAIKYKLKK